MDSNVIEQLALCTKYGASHCVIDFGLKLGISKEAIEGILPLNGVRYPAEGDTSGWYIWGGEETSKDEDFFLPLHISHLHEIAPNIIKYLSLPPGWRFLVVPGEYEDVWQDGTLLSS